MRTDERVREQRRFVARAARPLIIVNPAIYRFTQRIIIPDDDTSLRREAFPDLS